MRINEAGWEIQSILCSKKYFKTEEAAKKWVLDHGFRVDKVDETDDYFRYRQEDPARFSEFRTIDLGPNVKGVYGKLKKGVTSMKDIVRKMSAPGMIRGIDLKERTITAYVSTNEWDRYGERFESDSFRAGMENYLKNPVVLWAHDYARPPIAKTLSHYFD